MTHQNMDSSIALFVKYPEKGKVKTRLAQHIGDSLAASLYRQFILDILSTSERVKADIHLFIEPPNSYRKFSSWLGRGYVCFRQEGKDLGEKMKNAFLREFENGYKKSVIIGSDVPDLPSDILKRAFMILERRDVVIGASMDGGYYLIGFRKNSFSSEIFQGVRWSSNKVFTKSIEILNKKKLKYKTLPKWQDVDTIEDLKALFFRNKESAFRNSKTISYLYAKKNEIFMSKGGYNG